MLTPDVTGQVRARLQNDAGATIVPSQSDFVTPGAVTQSKPTITEPPRATPPSQQPTQQQSAPVRPAAPAPQQPVKQTSTLPLIGFLVSFDSGEAGEYFELRAGRHIITSENNGAANNIYIADQTVSPMHAILRVTPTGAIQILDQLSEHGTKLRRFGATEVEELSGDKAKSEHGDTRAFGQRTFHICVITRGEE